MNPTLASALATLPVTLKWATRYNPAEAYSHITTADAVVSLDARLAPQTPGGYQVLASVTGPGRPVVIVRSHHYPDLRSAWTEVAEVVGRVDAAAGAAMGNPRESKADAQPKPYRTGDVVRHKPSGEEWLVADVTSTHIGCAGWPHTMAPFADVELVEAATDVYHLELLQQMANMGSPDPRRSYAQEVLAKMAGTPPA